MILILLLLKILILILKYNIINNVNNYIIIISINHINK